MIEENQTAFKNTTFISPQDILNDMQYSSALYCTK